MPPRSTLLAPPKAPLGWRFWPLIINCSRSGPEAAMLLSFNLGTSTERRCSNRQAVWPGGSVSAVARPGVPRYSIEQTRTSRGSSLASAFVHYSLTLAAIRYADFGAISLVRALLPRFLE